MKKQDGTYLIAEIGTNYNGSVDLALQSIDAAVEAGADAVKFQIISAGRSYCRTSESYPIFKAIELSKGDWGKVIRHAGLKSVDCFATFVTPKDLEDFEGFDFPLFKVSSSNLTNFPLLKTLAKKGRPVLVSTGMSHLEEIREVVSFLRENGLKEIALLQCTSLYPAPMEKAHLRVLQTLKDHFPECTIGFSDHTTGILAAVQSIREVEKALGSGVKAPSQGEMPYRDTYRRSLVALRNIRAGEVLSDENVGPKRSPVRGLAPRDLEKILGRNIRRDLSEDETLSLDMLD